MYHIGKCQPSLIYRNADGHNPEINYPVTTELLRCQNMLCMSKIGQ